MPYQQLSFRPIISALRQVGKRLTMERIIRSPVLEFIFQAAADFNAIFRRDGDIAAVEETVEIATKKEAVVDGMRTAFIKGLDMSCLEGRKRMFLGNSAGATIGVGDEYPKRALTEARMDKDVLSVSGSFFDSLFRPRTRQAGEP